MFDDVELDRWRETAGDALVSSRGNAAAGWHNWACMMAEQSAQLAVKGILHGLGLGGQARGPDLVGLLETAEETAGLALTEDIRAAALRLTRHYQPTRYPDALAGGTPHGRYGPQDSETALADAELIVAAIDRAIDALRTAAADDGDRGRAQDAAEEQP